MTSSNGNIFRVTGLCAGNSPVTGEFPTQRPVTRSFDVFFELPLNTWLSKQSLGWWFETPSRPLWRHYNGQHRGTKHNWHSDSMWKYLPRWNWTPFVQIIDSKSIVQLINFRLLGTQTLSEPTQAYCWLGHWVKCELKYKRFLTGYCM